MLTYRPFAVVGPLILLAIGGIPLASAGTVYDDLPNPLPQSSPSLGFQAQHTSEFGDLVQIAAGATLVSARVLMTDWARFSDYPSYPAGGWDWPITLTFYNVATDTNGNPQPGTVINTVTQTFTIPWQPVSPGSCTDATKFLASDGQCHHGFNDLIMFTLPNVTVPSEFIYGITFNTQDFGPNPTHDPNGGPYISLNLAVNDAAPPTVGTRPFPDTAYWNTAVAGNYADGGTDGVGIFRRDTGWTPDSTAALFSTADVVPEPGTLGLLCGGLLMLAWVSRRKRG